MIKSTDIDEKNAENSIISQSIINKAVCPYCLFTTATTPNTAKDVSTSELLHHCKNTSFINISEDLSLSVSVFWRHFNLVILTLKFINV